MPGNGKSPPPLVALNPNGPATVIGYNVPEPTSYSGKNFIDLSVPAAWFKPVGSSSLVAGAEHQASFAMQGVFAQQTLGTANTAGVAEGRAIQVPPSVVVDRSGPADASPIAASPYPLTDRLARLTNADVDAITAAEKQVVVYRAVSGQLDYRVVDMPVRDVPIREAPIRAAPILTTAAGSSVQRVLLASRHTPLPEPNGAPLPEPNGGTGEKEPIPQHYIYVRLDSPTDGSAVSGPAAGVTITCSGIVSAEGVNVDEVWLRVDQDPVIRLSATTGPFTAMVTIISPGPRVITVTATGSGPAEGKYHGGYKDTASASVKVNLDPTDSKAPPVLPTVTITDPAQVLLAPTGTAMVTIHGTTTHGPSDEAFAVTVTDSRAADRSISAQASGNDFSQWQVELVLDGTGDHVLTATSTDKNSHIAVSSPVTITLRAQLPFRRLLNRLLIVETLNLSSFLGDFGAGRVIKTFSLLPGEKTTISIKSYTKTLEDQKNASSIIDSNASDCASDFEDSLTAEQANKHSQTEAQNYHIGASLSVGWGFGSASLDASYSGSANSAREEAVKNVSNATRKHSLKASTNRNITINTEYQVHKEATKEESTVREIANINVSRTLNFVFRQMNQEHVTLIHLTNVRVAHYTEDLMLDKDGQPASVEDTTDKQGKRKILHIVPTYREVALPELRPLLTDALTDGRDPSSGKKYPDQVEAAIVNALMAVPNYKDVVKPLIEWVEPKDAEGKPAPGTEYLRFRRDLSADFEDSSGPTFHVPGLLLAYDHVVMRTEGVLVDAVLGEGNGLDPYSHGLQDAAVAERQLAIAERQAEVDRQALARKIVADKDEVAAGLYAKLFPPPPRPPILVVENGKLPIGMS